MTGKTLLLLCVLLSACAPAATVEPTALPPLAPSLTPPPTLTRTAAPTLTATATGTPTPQPTSTLTMTPEPTQPPQLMIADADYRIAYIQENQGLMVMKGDGSDARLLTRNISWGVSRLSWSPDGKYLAFDFNYDIYVIGVDGKELRNLTGGRQGNCFTPAWSPDGEWIAYHSSQMGRKHGSGQDWGYDIFAIHPDGSGTKNLTADLSARYVHQVSWTPSWSPDGNWIAFSFEEGEGGTEKAIYIMQADGANPVKATFGGGNYNPLWSPRGDKVAFESNRDGDRDLYFFNPAAASQVTQLTNNSDWGDRLIAWLPDGVHLLVYTEGGLRLYNTDSLQYGTYFFYKAITMMQNANISAAAWAPPPPPRYALPKSCPAEYTRLQAGMKAVVSKALDLPNRVRSEPKKGDNIIAQIYPGTTVIILEGPVCADGVVWWKVAHSSIPDGGGWMAEGDGETFFLDPLQ